MARQRKKHHFWRNLLILIVLFGIYLYWGNRSIETDEATFTSGALPAGFDGCRIVQLSDLHGKYFGKDNERLYRAVKAAQPEYIFVTGDLVDRKTENPTIYAGEAGAALSAIAPTYYVTGNHEWGHGTKVVEEIKRTLRESGVTVLSNEFTYLARNGDTIVLAGIDDRLRRPGNAVRACSGGLRRLRRPLLAAARAPKRPLCAGIQSPRRRPDALRPRPRRHLEISVRGRGVRHAEEPLPHAHGGLLFRQRHIRLRQPRARKLAARHPAHSEQAAGGGHHTGKGLRLCVNFLPEATTSPSSARATRASRHLLPVRASA